MKIFAISDLHLTYQADKPMDLFGAHWTGYEDKILADWNAKVGDGDVGIIAGDISWGMRMADTEKDFDYLRKLKGTKIVVRGNHDYWWSSIGKVREALGEGVVALQNDAVKMGNVVFAGTRGWKVEERYQKLKTDDKKIHDREVIRLDLALKDAEKKREGGDKLVVILHFPPFNAMRDDSEFTKLLEHHKVDVCVYGHLHSKGGRKDLVITKNGITYYLTSCDQLGFSVAEILP